MEFRIKALDNAHDIVACVIDAVDEADRSGAWATFAFQEDLARVLVMEYSGDLAGAAPARNIS